jgi:hypothetical protein
MRASRISVPHRSNGAPGGHGARFGLSPLGMDSYPDRKASQPAKRNDGYSSR